MDRIASSPSVSATPVEETEGTITVLCVPVNSQVHSWDSYIPTRTNVTATFYFFKILKGLKQVQIGQYRLSRSNNHIKLKRANGTIVWQCDFTVSNARNLYIELYAADYNLEAWFMGPRFATAWSESPPDDTPTASSSSSSSSSSSAASSSSSFF